jgi:hypothetical protein
MKFDLFLLSVYFCLYNRKPMLSGSIATVEWCSQVADAVGSKFVK